MPETTSTLHYEMTQRFLLTPGCDGVPKFFPDNEAERLMVKNPAQFRDFYGEGQRLDEELGQRLAEWAAGVKAADPVCELVAEMLRDFATVSAADLAALEKSRADLWPKLNSDARRTVKAASDAAKKRATVTPAAQLPDLDENGTPIGPPAGVLFDGSAGVPH